MTDIVEPGSHLPPRSAALRAAVVLAACVAGARYLHALGSQPWAHVDARAPQTWLSLTPAEDVVAALLRLAALGACWWVAGSLLVAVAVRVVGWRPALGLADRLSPRAVRRLADQVTGGTLLAVSLLGPATPAFGHPIEPGEAPAVASFAPPGATPDSPATGSGPRDVSVRVRPGDHLWGIARAELARRRGVGADVLDAATVAPYWRGIVEANRHRLRSGDPDVLFPGEVVLLPGDSTASGPP